MGSRSEFEELLEGAWEAVIATDDGWTVKYMNGAAERSTGVPRDRAVGRPLAELVAGDYTGERPSLGEEWHCERLVDGWAVYGTAKAGQGAHRLQRMLEAEQLAAVGQVATTVAQEIGAPLTAISVAAEYLLKRECGAGQGASELRMIQAQVHRIGTLSRRLVDLAKPGEAGLGPIDLDEAVAGAYELVAKSCERIGIATSLSLGTSPCRVRGDASQIQQVLINLLLNARRAMESGGGALEIGTRIVSDWAEIRIADTGPGVPPEDAHRIFLPFFSRSGGTGLGLALARQIVYHHGGTIGVVGTPGGGATFMVRLPLVESDD